MSLLHMFSAITAARRVSMFLLPNSRTSATMALLPRVRGLRFCRCGCAVLLPAAAPVLHHRAPLLIQCKVTQGLGRSKLACNVVRFAARHEHGDGAHVEQLRAGLQEGGGG